MGRKGRKYSNIAEKMEDDVGSSGSQDNKPVLFDACAIQGDASSATMPIEQAEEDEDDEDEERLPVEQAEVRCRVCTLPDSMCRCQAKASAPASSTRVSHVDVSRDVASTTLETENIPRSRDIGSPVHATSVAASSALAGPNKENTHGGLAESVMFPGGSTRQSAALDTESDRRIMSAAATIGGTAGMLLLGPMSGVALGTAAAYATTRDSRTGIVARNASAAYLHVSDRAVDKGLQAVDRALDEGCKRLSKSIDPSSVPALVRPVLQTLTDRPGPVRTANGEEARQMRVKYPDRIPVLCERSPYSDLPEISKRKFAVPGTMLCGEFKYIVHKLVLEANARNPKAEKTIYIFVKGITPKTSTPMSELYEQLRAADGFLHVRYCAENTLG